MTLFAIRKGERRDAWAAFLTLFALIGSHSLLETARDALFLAHVPASRLPWVYLAIALCSFVLVKVQALVAQSGRPERTLAGMALFAATGTFGFFWLFSRLGTLGLYALYTWSGLLATLLVVHFWALVADRFTITQGKRLYGFIGAGSVLGAIVGSGAAALASSVMAPRRLLLVAAFGFAVGSVMTTLFGKRSGADWGASASPRFSDTVAYVRKDRYASRIAVSLLSATVCLTLGDFVFKSAAAELVPKEQLGSFFGMVYFAGNALSLICQLWLVGAILKRVSLGAALALLPGLFVLGGLGVAITGGLGAVLALKTADGALRYSLHRTAAELLFLPLSDEPRRRIKAFVDVVGQRGGQVLASGLILGLAALGAPDRALAFTLAVLACLWLASALALRAPYLELFRARLRAGRGSHIDEFPELDVASLEAVLGALESHNDKEVMAALDILEREQKVQLIPALILYHPSQQVVMRALAVMTRGGRTNSARIIDRMIDHAAPPLRAAMIAARSALVPDAEALRTRLEQEESEEVRASIIVNLIASGHFSRTQSEEHVAALLQSGDAATKVALAEAIERRAAKGFDATLIALTHAPETEVKLAAISAMSRVKATAFVPSLIDALVDEPTRNAAERVLAEYGDVAFDALSSAFRDTGLNAALRWRIPPAMVACNQERAMQTLLAWLPDEPNGSIRFQIVRTLEALIRKQPKLPVDRSALARVIQENLSRAYKYLNARVLLAQGGAEHAARKTSGHQLLSDLLRDKESNARARLFRLLSLLHPSEDFGQIYRGLAAGRDLRATSLELIESILQEPLRSAVLGLVDDGDGDDQRRLTHAGPYHQAVKLDYSAVLAHLIRDDGDAVREVAQYHAAEISAQPGAAS